MFFIFIVKVFIGILGESFEIQFLAIFYILTMVLIKFEIELFVIFIFRVSHWNIRGTLIQNTPLIVKIDHRVYQLGGRFSNRERGLH